MCKNPHLNHSPEPDALEQAADNFTASCTLWPHVLGVGDRHSDDILLENREMLYRMSLEMF